MFFHCNVSHMARLNALHRSTLEKLCPTQGPVCSLLGLDYLHTVSRNSRNHLTNCVPSKTLALSRCHLSVICLHIYPSISRLLEVVLEANSAIPLMIAPFLFLSFTHKATADEPSSILRRTASLIIGQLQRSRCWRMK